jgi:hypothetical protein
MLCHEYDSSILASERRFDGTLCPFLDSWLYACGQAKRHASGQLGQESA